MNIHVLNVEKMRLVAQLPELHQDLLFVPAQLYWHMVNVWHIVIMDGLVKMDMQEVAMSDILKIFMIIIVWSVTKEWLVVMLMWNLTVNVSLIIIYKMIPQNVLHALQILNMLPHVQKMVTTFKLIVVLQALLKKTMV